MDTAELCGQSNKVKTMLNMSKLPQGSLFHLVWLSNAQQTYQFSLISLHARAFLVVQMGCSEVTLTGLHDNFAWDTVGDSLWDVFNSIKEPWSLYTVKKPSTTSDDNHGITWWTFLQAQCPRIVWMQVLEFALLCGSDSLWIHQPAMWMHLWILGVQWWRCQLVVLTLESPDRSVHNGHNKYK